MFTLFFITLLGLALFIASLPVVLFALMLETARERGARPAKAVGSVVAMMPERFELEVRAAA